jgi:hypothetical protein
VTVRLWSNNCVVATVQWDVPRSLPRAHTLAQLAFAGHLPDARKLQPGAELRVTVSVPHGIRVGMLRVRPQLSLGRKTQQRTPRRRTGLTHSTQSLEGVSTCVPGYFAGNDTGAQHGVART